jgi:hypothetical protein
MTGKKNLTVSQINKPVTHLELALELTRLKGELEDKMSQNKSEIISHIDAFVKLHTKMNQEQTVHSHKIKDHSNRIQKLENNYHTI